jgi:hypothetical protein
VNRTKALPLTLFAAYWVAIIVILVAARPVYDALLAQAVRLSGDPRPAEIATLLALTTLLALLSTGVVRGWRWTFWLIVVVFLVDVVRAPISALQVAGITPLQGPIWYVAFQGIVGLVQFGIALAMLAGYRKAGVWGNF